MSKGILYILCATILFATQGVITKIAYSYDVTLAAMLFLRFVPIIPFLWLFFRPKSFVIDTVHLQAIAAGVLGYYLAPFLGLESLHFIKANMNGFILTIFPAFVMLIKLILYKKAPSILQLVCFLTIQAGVYLIAIHSDEYKTIRINDLYGIILALSSALVFAVYIIINERITTKMNSAEFVFVAMNSAFVAAGIYALSADMANTFSINQTGWVIIATSGIIQLAALYFIAEGLSLVDSTKASIIASSNPLFVALFAYMALNETLLPYQWIGGGVILVTIFVLEISKRRET